MTVPDGSVPTTTTSRSSSVSEGNLVRGTRALAAAQLLSQVARFASNIVLAHLLVPADFGVVAIALVIVLVSTQFQDLGTGSAIIQRPDVSGSLVNAVFHLNLVLGVGLTAAIAALAYPIAHLLRTPDAAPMIAAMSCMILVTALGQIHHALLRRDMRFRQTAVISSSASLASTAISITLAALGLGPWAIVIGSLGAAVLDTSLAWWFDPWRPRWRAHWAELESIWRFSLHLFLSNLVVLVFQQSDKAIVGRALGTAPLGYYSMAQRMVAYPTTAISGVVTEVAFPAFARRQDDAGALRSAYLRLTGVLALVTFPLLFGAATVAAPAVSLAFGSRWDALVPLIQILAPVAALQTVLTNWSALVVAKGRTGWLLAWNALSTLAMVVAFVVGSRHGLVGVCVAYAAAALIFMPIGVVMAFRLIELRLRDFGARLAPIAVATTAMVLASVLGQYATSTWFTAAVGQLAVGVVCGAAAYLAALWLWRPSAIADVNLILATKRRSRSGSEVPLPRVPGADEPADDLS